MAFKLALNGGVPVRRKAFPNWPQWGRDDKKSVLSAVESGNWGGYPFPNTRAQEFARAFCKLHIVAHGVCVANGTVAIEVALKAIDIRPGDEVIVPAYTWEGTVAPVLRLNATPVFADCDPQTYCISVESAKAALSSRTRAIIVVHLGMRFADLDAFRKLADDHNLALIEDCAHAQGGQWKKRGAGSIGDAGTFSFQSSKTLTAGEGGLVVTQDLRLYERIQTYVNCGRASLSDEFGERFLGMNYRLSELQAALLLSQLRKFKAQRKRRNANAKRLTKKLARIPGLRPLTDDRRITEHAVYQYVFRYDAGAFAGVHRDVFAAALQLEGIPCDGKFYEAVYRSDLFDVDRASFPSLDRDPRAASCPNAERAAYEEAVWIPHYILLGSGSDTDDIAEACAKIQRYATELVGAQHPMIELKRMNRADRARAERRQW